MEESFKLSALQLWVETQPLGATWNMAVDEALLRHSSQPVLRVYFWKNAAVSAGIRFNLERPLLGVPDEMEVVKRITGGGLVWHGGEDTTFSLSIPNSWPDLGMNPRQSYRWLHGALAQELTITTGKVHRLASDEESIQGDACFTAPVTHDILCEGVKVVGGAQKRDRVGFLHQGSIQGIKLTEGTAWESLARRLAADVEPYDPPDDLLRSAVSIAQERYSTPEWHRPGTAASARKKVFVYGTLKRGGGNHIFLQGQQFCGTASTLTEHRLYNVGGYPALVDAEGGGYPVEGEVWEVDDHCLSRLDQLEGISVGLFERIPLPLRDAPFTGDTVFGYRYLRDVKSAPEVGPYFAVG